MSNLCDCGHQESDHELTGLRAGYCAKCSCARYCARLKSPAPEYPEHAKLGAINDKSQAIGEFLDWLETGPLGERYGPVVLAFRMLMTDYGSEWEGRYLGPPDARTDRFYPLFEPKEKLLALFFGIDLDVIEKEKRAMVESTRVNP